MSEIILGAIFCAVISMAIMNSSKIQHESKEVTMQYKKDTKGVCYAFYNDSAIATVPCEKVGL